MSDTFYGFKCDGDLTAPRTYWTASTRAEDMLLPEHRFVACANLTEGARLLAERFPCPPPVAYRYTPPHEDGAAVKPLERTLEYVRMWRHGDGFCVLDRPMVKGVPSYTVSWVRNHRYYPGSNYYTTLDKNYLDPGLYYAGLVLAAEAHGGRVYVEDDGRDTGKAPATVLTRFVSWAEEYHAGDYVLGFDHAACLPLFRKDPKRAAVRRAGRERKARLTARKAAKKAEADALKGKVATLASKIRLAHNALWAGQPLLDAVERVYQGGWNHPGHNAPPATKFWQVAALCDALGRKGAWRACPEVGEMLKYLHEVRELVGTAAAGDEPLDPEKRSDAADMLRLLEEAARHDRRWRRAARPPSAPGP